MKIIVGLILVLILLIPCEGSFAQNKEGLPDMAKISSLTGKEKIEKAQTMMTKIKDIIKFGLDLKEKARSEKNVVRINCITEALANLKALLRLAEKHFTQLQEGISEKNDDESNVQFINISLAYSKAEEFDSLMRSCGAPVLEGGVDTDPEVVVKIAEDTPKEDPDSDLYHVVDILDEPPPASAFQ